MATFVDFSTPHEQALALAGHFDRLLKIKTQAAAQPTSTTPVENTPATEGAATPAKPTEPETEFHAECRKVIEKKNYVELLDKLLSTNLFLEGQEKEIESTFNLFLSILLRDSSSHDSIFSKILSNLTSSSSDRPLLRLKLLGTLYNVLDANSPLRFDFFLSLLRLANDSGNSELLLPQFEKIDKHLSSQFRETLDPEKLRQVYQLELDILRSSKTPSQSSAVAAHSMLVKYLTTFANPTETEALAKVETLAVEAAIGAIKLPEIVESIDELLRIPAIGQLKSTKPKLWELLSLFAKDSLNEFEKFVAENPAFLKDSGLDEQECLKKIRLLTLATLASESAEDQIPYAAIAGRLKIEESDVEGWVIRAISAGILGAKLDQLRRVAVITKATQRVFGKAQWEVLEGRLGGWKQNVRQLQEMVGKNQSPKI